MRKKEKPPFRLSMTRNERILGRCYLPVHLIVLPVLLNIFAALAPDGLSERGLNIAYYGLGALYVLVFMRRCLREDFDTLLDHKAANFLYLFCGGYIYLLLAVAANIVLELLLGGIGGLAANPNEQALDALESSDSGLVLGLAVFLAPLVEEVLFRGVVFGSLREKSRLAAYLVSVALFSLYHVWQYALAYGDVKLLLYALQYVPVSIVLALLYEQSGSLWMPVFFHMLINFVSSLPLPVPG